MSDSRNNNGNPVFGFFVLVLLVFVLITVFVVLTISFPLASLMTLLFFEWTIEPVSSAMVHLFPNVEFYDFFLSYYLSMLQLSLDASAKSVNNPGLFLSIVFAIAVWVTFAGVEYVYCRRHITLFLARHVFRVTALTFVAGSLLVQFWAIGEDITPLFASIATAALFVVINGLYLVLSRVEHPDLPDAIRHLSHALTPRLFSVSTAGAAIAVTAGVSVLAFDFFQRLPANFDETRVRSLAVQESFRFVRVRLPKAVDASHISSYGTFQTDGIWKDLAYFKETRHYRILSSYHRKHGLDFAGSRANAAQNSFDTVFQQVVTCVLNRLSDYQVSAGSTLDLSVAEEACRSAPDGESNMAPDATAPEAEPGPVTP